MLSKLVAQRLFALFCSGWLLLNFPLLGLWDIDVTVMGLPLLPTALLGLWAILIGALAWLMEGQTKTEKAD
nr:hypothetical protein [uncultured Rhodoferax sp.]